MSHFPDSFTVYAEACTGQYSIPSGLPIGNNLLDLSGARLYKVDIIEYLEYWELIDSKGIPSAVDHLDVGGMLDDGVTFKPEYDFRANIILELKDITKCDEDLSVYQDEENGCYTIAIDGKDIASFRRTDHAIETVRAMAHLLGDVEINLF